MSQPPRIDSQSVGDPERYRTFGELEERLRATAAPADAGRVTLIVRRGEAGLRESPQQVRLGCDTGVLGDAWARRPQRKVDGQISVMQHGIATLIANGQPLTLFGDNLFLDLDLSVENLPPDSRVRIGAALLEVTPKPHTGCHKFRARFGEEALRFVNAPELRHRNLRGIYMRVLSDGDISVGDSVEIVSRVEPE